MLAPSPPLAGAAADWHASAGETFESLSVGESLEPKLRVDRGRQAAVDEAESHT